MDLNCYEKYIRLEECLYLDIIASPVDDRVIA
jgi:hypothetical protein